MDKRVSAGIGAIIAVILITSLAFGDSCPYCGQEYGEGPSGSAYIARIRAQHEATCSARSSGGGGGGYGGYDNSRQRLQEAERRWRQKQDRTYREQREMLRREKEEARLLEEERRRRERKEEFQKNKSELTSSLRGMTTGSLKGGGGSSELPLKGLKIREVPLPGGERLATPQGGLKLKSGGSRQPSKKKNIVVQAMIKSYEKLKQDFIDWTKTTTFEMTFGRIPGVSHVKALYDKAKSMYDEMKSLNMNIFQYAMKGMQDGVERSATADLSDGGLSDEYEEGRKGLFGRTFIKARELLKKELDSE